MAELAGLALPSITMTSSTDEAQVLVLMLPGVLRRLGARLEDREDDVRELAEEEEEEEEEEEASVCDRPGTSLTEGGEMERFAWR